MSSPSQRQPSGPAGRQSAGLDPVEAELSWYLAKTAARREDWAIENLEAQGFEAYMPLRLVADRRGLVSARPLFPRHVFFRVGPTAAGWRMVFSTRGIQSVYRSGDHPAIVPTKVIDRCRKEEVEGLIKIGDPKLLAAAKAKPKYHRGERVTIRQGSFEGLDAIFLEQVDAGRLLILIKLFGRETRVSLDMDHLT